MTTNDDQPMLPLPGLDPDPKPGGALVAAVRRTIAALERQNVLSERHAATLALALALAQSIDGGAAARRASAVAMAAKELREVLAILEELATGDDDELDPFDALAKAMAEAEGRGATT